MWDGLCVGPFDGCKVGPVEGVKVDGDNVGSDVGMLVVGEEVVKYISH